MAPQGRIAGGRKRVRRQNAAAGAADTRAARSRPSVNAPPRNWPGSHTVLSPQPGHRTPGAKGGLNREIIKGLSPALIGPG